MINRIRPLMNILSGYQRLNRYDVDFVARTSDDVELCQVRRGLTKYIMDRSDYDAAESQVFLDCAIGGLGWFGVRYKIDHEIQDGEALIERIDPFSMYVDPEAHELDYSDARYLIRAKWVAKDELKQVYPEQAEAIENNFAVYDSVEYEGTRVPKVNALYYSTELKKVRVVECWYKERTVQTIFFTADGQQLSQEQVTPEMIQAGIIAGSQDIPREEVKLCVFFDQTLLEENLSPYQHGEFPYVPMVYHNYGVGDVPAGDLQTISGINESLLGVEVPSQASGRAIELRQRQAVTHLAVIFDSLRRAKKKIVNLLWGRRGHAGVVPQFYTAEKVYRVEGENGQQYIQVNQQITDPIAGTVVATLNDLSQGEFDVVIADVESSTTQRQAQLWSLVDAASKLGIPHELIFETMIDLSDLPKKNDIKARYQQQQQTAQEQAQQAQQAQMELERIKNADFRMQIAFKDAPLPIQFAMAAQAGLIDRSIADYFVQVMVQNLAPQLAQQIQPQQI